MLLGINNSSEAVLVLYSLSVLVTEKMFYHALEECKFFFLLYSDYKTSSTVVVVGL